MVGEDGEGLESSIDILAALFIGNGDHASSNDGTSKRCSEKVDILDGYQ